MLSTIDGIAMFTIVRSSSVMKRPRLSTASAAIGCLRSAFTGLLPLVVVARGEARLSFGWTSRVPVSRREPGLIYGPLEFTLRGAGVLKRKRSAHRQLLLEHRWPLEAPVPQLGDRAPQPLELRPAHGLSVFLFDGEEPRQLRRQLPQPGVEARDLGLVRGGPAFEDLDRFLLVAERPQEHEGSPKAGVLAGRLLQQVAHPRVQLIRPRRSEAVDRPLRPASIAIGQERLDEARLGQPLDGVVNRCLLERDRAGVLPFDHPLLHFVGMHGSFGKQLENRQREQGVWSVTISGHRLIAIDYIILRRR